MVHGRVQGVGFRMFVVREAGSRGIRGFVRNLAGVNEAVEVVACGDEPSLSELVARLHVGPAGAHVTEVTASALDPVPEYADFAIRY